MGKNILIIDDNSDFVVSLYKYIQCEIPELNIVGIASDGEEAIEYIDKLKPNIILLDLQMPKLDGIEVLKKVKNTNIKVIIITGDIQLVNNLVLQDFQNIERVYIKPFEFGKLKEDMKYLIEENEGVKLRKIIDEELANFNFNRGSVGYRYLVQCIIEVYENPNKLNNVESLLFPEIARKLKVKDPKSIKWSLQKLLNSMERYTDTNIIVKYFPNAQKPTPKMFIAEICKIISNKYY